MLPFDEIFRHAASQRPRPVEGHHRDQILEPVRVKLHEKGREAGGFGLEHTDGVSLAEHAAGFLIFRGNIVDIQMDAPVFLYHFQGIMDDRQVSEPQKVHLQKPQLFHLILFVLGLDEIVLGELDST